MLVSWNWLQDYVSLNDVSIEELTNRLTMSGLNLEEYRPVNHDFVIDLEVTSNRPDCLGHLGVAREIAVLLNRQLKVPQADCPAGPENAAEVIGVSISAPEMCSQYHARIIRGVKIGPSPEWLRSRLATVGIASVNNVVDITNYVMLECSQPLHAFDLDRIQGGQIHVRQAREKETLRAINQRDYLLTPDQCVIADAVRPVAIAGIMGGFDTEISEQTVNVLIESAAFAPLVVRNTARKLDLHSPSSYRFERALDPQGPLYASNRCCQLILDLAGGTLLRGTVSAGDVPPVAGCDISLRYARIERILGIEIPRETADRILLQLGLTLVSSTDASGTFRAPSYRRDLTREIDLVEEVARIYGYDHLPGSVVVPLCTSSKSERERVVERIGEALVSASYYEAITPAFVSPHEQQWFQPYGDHPSLRVEHSSRRQENLLRQSLIPSLLASRRANERLGNFNAQLFEIAKVYLQADPGLAESVGEPWMIGLVTERSYRDLKGVVELLARRIQPAAEVSVRPSNIAQFTPGRGAEVLLNGKPWGWLGELDRAVCDLVDLKDVVCVAELRLDVLEQSANLVPQARKLSEYPSIARDLNFVLDENVAWSDLEATVRESAGPLLQEVEFASQYRGKQLGEGKKSYVVKLLFRSSERTLTGEEVDDAQSKVVDRCEKLLAATLRA